MSCWKTVVLQQLICGECEGPGPSAPKRAYAAQEAVALGWTHSGGQVSRDSDWVCPECKTVSPAECTPGPGQ